MVNRIHQHLVVERAGSVATLRIDREEALGALSREILETLDGWVRQVHSDPSIRAVIITGTGKGFIAGADIGEYRGVSTVEFDSYQRLSRSIFTAVTALPQPVIAAVNGYALGGGFELALCCDVIIASERAKFGLPEIKLGLLPGGGGTQRLARVAGTRFAKYAVLTGEFFTAADMLARGVVTEVCPPQRLMERATEIAGSIAAAAPLAVRAAKRLVDDGAEMPLEVGLTVEQQVLSQLFATDDATEGITAFHEKRPPQFSGK